jgi:ATP-binding cassette subfamily B protein
MSAPHVNHKLGREHIVQKPKDFKKAIIKLAIYSKIEFPLILFACVLAIGSVILTVIGPNKLRDITDYIAQGVPSPSNISNINNIKVNINGIFKVGTSLIYIYISSSLFSFVQNYIMSTVTQRVAKKMRDDIDHKINRVPLSYFTGHTSGDVLSRVTNDVDTVAQALNSSVANLVTAITQIIGCTLMMYITQWHMATAALICSILGFSLMVFIMKSSQKFFAARQESLGAINGYIEEIYTGHNVVRVSRANKEVINHFDNLNSKMREVNWKSQFFSGIMQPMFALIGNVGYVAVCVVGAVLTMNGEITFGVISAFILYIRLLTSPFRVIGQSMNLLQSAAAASERVFKFLEEDEMSPDKVQDKLLDPSKIRGDVEFKNVRFSYSDTPNSPTIKNFSAKVSAGQKVAIVGPTGAGKTTIVNLLMRFYDLSSGRIMIDGVSIMDMTRQQVHSLFGMVLQDTWTFDGTIKENIIYAKENISDETVVEAAKIAGVDHIIRALPGGYDMMLDETSSLSAGEKQLITIARAIVENAPMLILDEATSAVDTRTEQLIQQAMDKLTTGKTSFVIAHRLSTIKNADLILVLKDGDIVEQGNHEQLLQRGGFYSELYKSQFEQG